MRKLPPLLLALVLVPACNKVQGPPVQTPLVAWSSEGKFLPRGAGPGLVADPDSPIPDVPKPIGFKPVASQSSSHFDGRVRTVHHVYQGHGSPTELAQFYRQQLRRQGWEPVLQSSLTGGGDEATAALPLRFTKGDEALVITGSQAWGVTTLIIEMGDRQTLGSGASMGVGVGRGNLPQAPPPPSMQ